MVMRKARPDPASLYVQVSEIVRPWLYVHSIGGPFGIEAVALPLKAPSETPREARARLLGQAEDAFDALAEAGLPLVRLPQLEFKPSGDRMELLVWFSVRGDL
jgi:hypothetical protein